MASSKLIRFLDEELVERFGRPLINHADDVLVGLAENTLHAEVLNGSSIFSLDEKPIEKRRVVKVLPLLKPSEIPLIRCIGLNYIKHIKEGGRTPPPYPSVFTKPSTSLASYDEDSPIPVLAQLDQLDYEGELAIVIGKTGKNITKANALSHVAGYVVANDVSARTWQRDPKYAGPVPQWDFSKGFDKFAPIGALLVGPIEVGDARGLRLQTWVNGQLRQDSDTSDLLFGVREIIAFISQGTTLQQGTIILTGTPAGVAMGMKPVPKYLQDQDVVKVRIEGLGFVENKMAFESE